MNISTRSFSGREIKRFYKNVSLTQGNGCFEINLDHRKLRTPSGKLFQVPNEAIATAVANEWSAQEKIIKRHTMHLTSLCNTAIDNPTNTTRETKINAILQFLDTDTVCYRMEEPPELLVFQKEQWDPLLDWVKERYGIEMEATTGLGVPFIPEETRDIFYQHFMSYNDWSLVGIQQAIEVTKSLVITTALLDRHLGIERALELSRVEVLFQTGRWGNVEWYHEIERYGLQSRLASAVLFVHLNNEMSTIKSKQMKESPWQ